MAGLRACISPSSSRKPIPPTRSPSWSATLPGPRSAGASCSPIRRSAISRPPILRRSGRSPTTSPAGTTSTSISRGGRSPPAAMASPGIARVKLLEILQYRAAGLGVDLRFGIEVRDDSDLPGLGLGRRRPDRCGRRGQQRRPPRATRRSSGPISSPGKARYVWLGTTRLFDAFTFVFVENRARDLPGPRLPLQRPALRLHRRMR